MAVVKKSEPNFSVLKRIPPKLSIRNLSTGDILGAQFNPDELTETFEAKWNNVTVPGLSHELMQFSNSVNDKLSFKLFFTNQAVQSTATKFRDQQAPLDSIQYARRLLKSWTVPVPSAYSVTSAAPATLLLVWPQTLSFQCVLTKVDFKISNWDMSESPLGPSRAEAQIELINIVDAHFNADGIRDDDSRWGRNSNGFSDTTKTFTFEDAAEDDAGALLQPGKLRQ